jgi:cysteine sulfinate desulfinase/cysteine desulfurase-like protein
MGVSEDCALSALRISFGVETTEAEVREFADCLRKKVVYIREARRKSAELLPELQPSGGNR